MSQATERATTNRANSKLSTGPKTEAGKHRSSQNSLRHGLTSQLVVMPAEDVAAYRRHLQVFLDEYAPHGATESQLVQTLADAAWRLNRVVALESNILLRPDSEFESQSKSLANLSLHSQRLARQFERTVVQLRSLQSIRRAKEACDMEDLLDITEMVESTGETYDPSEDGFVFSPSQIDAASTARARDRRALDAFEHLQ